MDEQELLLLKQRQLQLAKRKLEAVRKDGLLFYKPHPKQQLFHESLARYRGVFTGNRWGKSTMGCAEDCAWARGERVWYPKGHPSRTSGIPQHPTKGCITVVDWEKAQEIWTGDTGKLWRFLPQDGFVQKVKRNSSGAVNHILCANKSTIDLETIKSYKSDKLSIESSDWDWLHFDEPAPEQMFKGMFRGAVDRGGYVWFTLTALSEPWITDAFEPDGMFTKGPFEGKCLIIEGSIHDNPYLTAQNIAEYEATLNEDEISCRINGKPLHKAGLIYKEFQRGKHILTSLPSGWRSWMEPPRDWSYYLYIDPHAAVPITVTFVTVDPCGRIYFYYDIFKKQLIGECCQQINSILDGRKLVRTRIDPCAFIEDPKDKSTWAGEFAKHGIYCIAGSKDLERGILRAQAALKHNPQYVFFTPACQRTLWEIGRYHWIPEQNKPVDVDDHAMENFRRAIVDEPRYVKEDMGPSIRDEVISGMPPLQLDRIKFAIEEHCERNLIPLN